MFCPNCGEKIDNNATYCPVCGYNLSNLRGISGCKTKKSKAKTLKCPECGKIIDSNFTVCPYCNHNFTEATIKKELEFEQKKKEEDNNFTYAIITLIFSFIIPIVGLILAFMFVNKDKNGRYRTIYILSLVFSSLIIIFYLFLIILSFR